MCTQTLAASHTLTRCLVDLCSVCPKEGPVVKHLTLLEESHAGRVVLQSHFHHSGILGHCIRTDKKQLQLDMSGELITSWLLAASRMLVKGQLVTTRLLVMSGEPYREQRLQLLLSRVSVNEKFSQTVLRGEGD